MIKNITFKKIKFSNLKTKNFDKFINKKGLFVFPAGPALASIEETLSRAVMLLTLYSLGLAFPFVLSGYLIQKYLLLSKNFKKNINLISKIGGVILLMTGILILTNQLQVIGFYIIEIFPFMQKFG